MEMEEVVVVMVKENLAMEVTGARELVPNLMREEAQGGKLVEVGQRQEAKMVEENLKEELVVGSLIPETEG
jgi:hypothetical protein